LVEIGLDWFLRRSHLKEKVDAGRTMDGQRTLHHSISSHDLQPGELKTILYQKIYILVHLWLMYCYIKKKVISEWQFIYKIFNLRPFLIFFVYNNIQSASQFRQVNKR